MKMSNEDREWALSVKNKIEKKMSIVSKRSQDKIPSTSINGVHDDKSVININNKECDGIDWWTNGFWGGIQWLLYNATREEQYLKTANNVENALDNCFERFYGLHHDVGFMWLHTAVANYKLTGNYKSRKRALMAATLLAGRFNPKGRFIRAWNGKDYEKNDNRGYAIIDCMMNINLLYWATEETGDPRFKNIAMAHADTTMKNFIRSDGSVKHICDFDPYTGEYRCSYGGQGYCHGSSWTRGQGWALYGFVLSYIHTKKIEYLETAKKVADYFISQVPENYVIPVDFKQPSSPDWEDSSAACIASCGLIELSRFSCENSERYFKTAINLLKTLDSRSCDYSLDDDCIVNNCSSAYHVNQHNNTLIYADEFYIEAIYKLLGDTFTLW